MNNYQLYRTNLLLGGQLKWDLIINSTQNTLYVSDFHITPISNNMPYTYKSDEYIVKNSHQDNIKKYYAENKGNFYNEYLNSEFIHNWPIICEEGEYINAYSNIYDMGCKRSKRYNEYGKQFEFLCPIWLEHLNDNIKFKIDIKNISSGTILGSNTLIFKNIDNYVYHNAFIKYFNKYINDAGLDTGTDDVINTNFKTKNATVTGLNVESGIFETCNIDSLMYNLTSRERPVMEVDNMITQSFKDNNLICKQLFNFNLCFNMEDIFSANIVKLLYGENVEVSVTVYIGDNKLDIVDFNTEYEQLNRFIKANNNISIPENISTNVFDYFKDNRYIEFIDKNKFCQTICHWALCENPNYIFNVYEGFSGLYIEKNEKGYTIYENEHQYQDAPNTILKHNSKQNNSSGWITIYNATAWEDFYKYIKNTSKYKVLGTYIDGTKKYIHNIKYDYVPSFKGEGKYIIGITMNGTLLSTVINSFYPDCIRIFNKNVYIIYKDNLILILTDNINNITFAQFVEDLSKNYNINEFEDIKDTYIKYFLIELYKMLNSKIDPTFILFDKSLKYTKTTNLLPDSLEIEYFKNDNAHHYIVRYDGKIKPAFTTKPCTLYYKDYISDADNDSKLKKSIYTQYSILNIEPLYPSINYCAIKKLQDWSYDKYPIINVTEHDNAYICGNKYEYSWYNNSRCIILKPNISFTYIKRNTDTKTIDDIILEYIYKFYKLDDITIASFIKSLYEYKNNWEYLNAQNINDYSYNISMKLKF